MSILGNRKKTLNSVLTLIFSMSAIAPVLAADLHINGGGGGGGSATATNGGGGGGGYVGSANTPQAKAVHRLNWALMAAVVLAVMPGARL